MGAAVTTLLIVVGYAALAVWIAECLRALKERRAGRAGALLALPVVALCVATVVPAGLRLVVLIFVIGGALAAVAARRRMRPGPREPRAEVFPRPEMRTAILHLALITGSALFLIPLLWLVATSLKTDAQMTAYPPIWVPNPALWRNYPDALRFMPQGSGHGLRNVGNTLVIAVMQVIGTVLSSSMVAYGFARLRWPGRDWAFGLVLATMMMPGAVTMMPQFLIFRWLHWIDTLLPLWVPSFFGSAFNIFLLRQFFMGIPKELEDAARIDGCGPVGTWWLVMMPLVKPALAAVAIMTFLGAWKDFMGPLIYISSPEKMPVSYVLQLYNTAHGSEPGLLMAATTLVVLPVIVVFFFTQRYFIEGVTLTGLGGR